MSMDKIKGEAKRAGGALQESVGEFMDDDKQRMEGKWRRGTGEAQAQYGDMVESIKDYAQSKPFCAMGIAALAGLIVGRILRR